MENLNQFIDKFPKTFYSVLSFKHAIWGWYLDTLKLKKEYLVYVVKFIKGIEDDSTKFKNIYPNTEV